MPAESIESLLAPVAPGSPGGADLALSPDLDEIRTARKGEDAALAQGEWVRELRTPQWHRVRELSEAVLRDRSKDLQVACWYAEALTTLEGFKGLARGLQLLTGILERFWDTCHPALEGGTAEERIGRMEWLDANLSLAVKQVPLTAPGTGAHSWFRWEESLAVDNLGLRSPQARDDAIAEGKVSGEIFQKAVAASGPGFYEALHAGAQEALYACGALQGLLDQRLGDGWPGLEALAGAIRGCVDFVAQTRQRRFPPAPRTEAPGIPDPAPSGAPRGPIESRAGAIQNLRATAEWFRAREPHSPVALLVERAATWAEMPLEAWLAEVVKDTPTLTQIRELLHLKKDQR